MLIYAFSDFHGNRSAFQRVRELIRIDRPDLVAITGDIANHSVPVASEFLVSLNELGILALFVPGNMDDPELLEWSDAEFVKCLHGKSIDRSDLTFIGLGGAPGGVFGTPFEYSESEAERILLSSSGKIQRCRLALIAHSPPKNTKIDEVRAGLHAGSRTVRKFIEARKPLFSVSGHIHEAQGFDRIGETLVVNTGPALAGDFAKIHVADTVDVEFDEF